MDGGSFLFLKAHSDLNLNSSRVEIQTSVGDRVLWVRKANCKLLQHVIIKHNKNYRKCSLRRENEKIFGKNDERKE